MLKIKKITAELANFRIHTGNCRSLPTAQRVIGGTCNHGMHGRHCCDVTTSKQNNSFTQHCQRT